MRRTFKHLKLNKIRKLHLSIFSGQMNQSFMFITCYTVQLDQGEGEKVNLLK